MCERQTYAWSEPGSKKDKDRERACERERVSERKRNQEKERKGEKANMCL